ncbi:MAG: hypothetical protein ACQESF_02375 [Nanobdellota archaeon]
MERALFFSNFDGNSSINISGKVVRVVNKYDMIALNEGTRYEKLVYPSEPVTEAKVQLYSKSIPKKEIKTDTSGRFSIKLTLPEKPKRASLIGKSPAGVINVETIDLSSNSLRTVKIFQQSRPPRITDLKKRVSKEVGQDSFTTISFNVYDPEDDVQKVIIRAVGGKLILEDMEKGSDNNKDVVVLEKKFDSNPVEFGWKTPPLGLQFDADFISYQRKALKNNNPTDNNDFYNEQYASTIKNLQKDAKALMGPKAYDAFIDAHKSQLEGSMGYKYIIHTMEKRLSSAYKLPWTVENQFKDLLNRTEILFLEDMSRSEAGIRAMSSALSFVYMIDGGVATITGKNVVQNPSLTPGSSAKELENNAKMFAAQHGENVDISTFVGKSIKSFQAGLDYVADTMREGRAKKDSRIFNVYVTAVDSQGNRAFVKSVPIEVVYQNTEKIR